MFYEINALVAFSFTKRKNCSNNRKTNSFKAKNITQKKRGKIKIAPHF